MDTGLKLNVHKTFRRCLGRLMNVLYTFNFSLVSRGEVYFEIRILKATKKIFSELVVKLPLPTSSISKWKANKRKKKR